MEIGDPLAEPGMAAAGAVAECLLPVRLERPRRRFPYGVVGQDVGAWSAAREADRSFGHLRVEYTNGAILHLPGDGGRRHVRNTVARCQPLSSWSRLRSRPTATATARSRSLSPGRTYVGTNAPLASMGNSSGGATRSSGGCAATSTAGRSIASTSRT